VGEVKRKEWIVVILSSLYCAFNYWDRSVGFHKLGNIFSFDYAVYRTTALGDFTWRWIYKDYLSSVFVPLTWGTYQFTFIVWYVILSLALVYVCFKLTRTFKYGWIAVPFYLKFASITLAAGNIDALLGLACLSPVGVLIGGFFKPYLLGIGLVYAYQIFRGDYTTVWQFVRGCF
jgi:hypothetical protein